MSARHTRSLKNLANRVHLLLGVLITSQAEAQADAPKGQQLSEVIHEITSTQRTNILTDSELLYEIRVPANLITGEMERGAEHLYGHELIIAYLNLPDPTIAQAETGSSETVKPARVEPRNESVAIDSANSSRRSTQSQDAEPAVPEVLVRGTRTLNIDIKRSEDDAQPYVVFSREELENSGVNNLEEFFKQKLTTSVPSFSAEQLVDTASSQINLRGLGTDETLILVDGRRVAAFSIGEQLSQSDISGIPVAAVERIEVLSTTASGIYGGSATGGVINIVLRRDYEGVDASLQYGNAFKGDAATKRIELAGGTAFNGGRSRLLFAISYADANPLLASERDLLQRARQQILNNNPNFFNAASSPPLGATPNICSATITAPGVGLCNNTPLTLDNGVSLGSPITFVPPGYDGTFLDQGAGLTLNAGSYNLALAHTAQTGGGNSLLFSEPEIGAAFLTLQHQLTDRIDAFLDLRASNVRRVVSANNAFLSAVIPGNAPTNPFQQDIRVTVPTVGADGSHQNDSSSRTAIAGLIMNLPNEWRATLDYTWGLSKSSVETPPRLTPEIIAAANSGQLNVLLDPNQWPLGLQLDDVPALALSNVNARFSGLALRIAGLLPWSLPGGQLAVSSLLEYREESLDDSIISDTLIGQRLMPEREQSVSSIYLETRLPFVSSSNRLPMVEELELQLAARYDDYTMSATRGRVPLPLIEPLDRFKNHGSSLDPTIALKYRPISDLMFRLSYGTGYRPPGVHQLAPAAPRVSNFPNLRDPLRDSEALGPVVYVSGGGNPDLQPEESKSLSAGVVLTPSFLADFRFSVDWSRIDKSNNIGTLLINTQAGLEQAIQFFPEKITRGAPSGGFEVGPIVALDNSAVNVARMRAEAVDLSMDYRVQMSAASTLVFSANATRLLSLKSQASRLAPVLDYAGVQPISGTGGVKWRINGSVSWMRNSWSVGWSTRFYDSYYLNVARTVEPNQGSDRVSSQMYHDIYGSYAFTQKSAEVLGVLEDLELRFGVNNVFNKRPPVDVNAFFNIGYSPLGDPRLSNYYISLTKSFGGRGVL